MTPRAYRTFTRIVIACIAVAMPLGARLHGQSVGQIIKGAETVGKSWQSAQVTEAEEQQIGADVSAKLREKYGVVQDAAVHKYVSLVGQTLAQSSSRPASRWTFIVLDTDGVNAFAAPGGYVHITRGALAIIKNEGELADVLGHEISHVTNEHTIKAIRNSKFEGAMASAATRSDFLKAFTDKVYAMTLENHYDRSQEMDADKTGVALANSVGYAPTGLGAFLSRLAERNAGLKEPSGIFASHPETEARLTGLTQVIAKQKLTATALVEARYVKSITYKPVPVNQVAQVAPPSTTPEKKEEPKKGGSGVLGVSGLTGLGQQKQSNSTVASAGARGVNPDRDAKGGPNKAIVVVNVTATEIAEFKKGIT